MLRRRTYEDFVKGLSGFTWNGKPALTMFRAYDGTPLDSLGGDLGTSRIATGLPNVFPKPSDIHGESDLKAAKIPGDSSKKGHTFTSEGFR